MEIADEWALAYTLTGLAALSFVLSLVLSRWAMRRFLDERRRFSGTLDQLEREAARHVWWGTLVYICGALGLIVASLAVIVTCLAIIVTYASITLG